MSVGRTSFVPTLPFVLSPDDPAAPVAAPPAPAAPPAAAPPVIASPSIVPAQAPPAPGAPPTLASGGTPPAPSTPAAPAAAPPTIAAGGGTPPVVAVPATWPEKWRDDLAGDDKTFRAMLDRHDSPASVAKAYRELSTKVHSGELKAPPKPLAADAKPEEITAWRKEQGLPENPDAYVASLALPDGTVIGEADKPLLASFADAAMKANWTGTQYNQAVAWYYGVQDKLVADRASADSAFMLEAQTSLVQEWGAEFAVNRNVVTSFIEKSFPKELGDALLGARLPNGNIVGNDPGFNKAILAQAKEFNPAATLLPINVGSSVGTTDEAIAKHESNMKAPQGSDAWKAYWRDPKAQETYRGLLEARETMKARGKAA